MHQINLLLEDGFLFNPLRVHGRSKVLMMSPGEGPRALAQWEPQPQLPTALGVLESCKQEDFET